MSPVCAHCPPMPGIVRNCARLWTARAARQPEMQKHGVEGVVTSSHSCSPARQLTSLSPPCARVPNTPACHMLSLPSRSPLPCADTHHYPHVPQVPSHPAQEILCGTPTGKRALQHAAKQVTDACLCTLRASHTHGHSGQARQHTQCQRQWAVRGRSVSNIKMPPPHRPRHAAKYRQACGLGWALCAHLNRHHHEHERTGIDGHYQC